MSGHLITTPASLVPCDGCSRHVLACHAGGFRAYADPQSLSVLDEIAARLSDRVIYDVITWGLPKRLYLEYRDLIRVKAGRAHPVVAEHACASGRRPSNPVAGDPVQYPFTKPVKGKRKGVTDGYAECPF